MRLLWLRFVLRIAALLAVAALGEVHWSRARVTDLLDEALNESGSLPRR